MNSVTGKKSTTTVVDVNEFLKPKNEETNKISVISRKALNTESNSDPRSPKATTKRVSAQPSTRKREETSEKKSNQRKEENSVTEKPTETLVAASTQNLATAVMETHPNLTPLSDENVFPPLQDFEFEIPKVTTAATFRDLINLFQEVTHKFNNLKKEVDDLRVNCQDLQNKCRNVTLPSSEIQGGKREQYIQSQKAPYSENYEKYYTQHVANVSSFNKILPYIQKGIELFKKAKTTGDEVYKTRIQNYETLINSSKLFSVDIKKFPHGDDYPNIEDAKIEVILDNIAATLRGIDESDNEYLKNLNLEKEVLSTMETNLTQMTRRLDKDIPYHLTKVTSQLGINPKPWIKTNVEKGLLQSFLGF